MHPPLHRPHPECQEVVELLVKCHENMKLMKFFGACNDIKAELDLCFKKEKDVSNIYELHFTTIYCLNCFNTYHSIKGMQIWLKREISMQNFKRFWHLTEQKKASDSNDVFDVHQTPAICEP